MDSPVSNCRRICFVGCPKLYFSSMLHLCNHDSSVVTLASATSSHFATQKCSWILIEEKRVRGSNLKPFAPHSLALVTGHGCFRSNVIILNIKQLTYFCGSYLYSVCASVRYSFASVSMLVLDSSAVDSSTHCLVFLSGSRVGFRYCVKPQIVFGESNMYLLGVFMKVKIAILMANLWMGSTFGSFK